MSESLRGEHGTYRLFKELGSGGFGVTWLAERAEDGLTVVVKKLHTSRLEDWKSMELFEREAMVLESLDHPNIPRYLDSITLGEPGAPEGLALVQTYVEGESLEVVRSSPRTLQPPQMLGWFEDVLEILDYLHTRRPPVIHRDISPKNIMLAPNGMPYLIDFGTVQAKIASESNVGSTSAGTFGYSPHEQFVGRATPASDLYSLGVTFLAVATGRGPDELPYRDNRFVVRDAIAADGYAEHVLDVLHDMTEPNASDRPQSAAEVLRRLREPRQLPVPVVEPSSSDPGLGVLPLVLVLVPVLLAAGIGAAIYFAVMSAGPDSPDNPEEFDVQAFISDATVQAREAFADDAQLIGLSWSGVPRSGVVDLTREDASSPVYYFRSPSRIEEYKRAIENNPRVKPKIFCRGQVVVSDDFISASELENEDACAELLDATPPKCTLQEVWDKAIVMGAPLNEAGTADFRVQHSSDEALGRSITSWRISVEENYYEVYDLCGSDARITATQPPNFAALDVMGFIPTALQMVQERYPSLDLMLVSLDGDGIYPNGKADLTLNEDFDLQYSFTARLPPQDDSLPIGASERIENPCVSVSVRVEDNVARVYGGSVRECQVPVAPARCSVQQVWQKAIDDGAPSDNAVAKIRLDRSTSGDRWYVTIGDVYRDYLPDDCQ